MTSVKTNPNSPEHWVADALTQRRAAHLERTLIPYGNVGGRIEIEGRTFLNFSSNDYLNLSQHPRVLRAAHEALTRYGAGATSSRVVTGTLDLHADLESALARHKGYPAALVMGSGYLVNCGIVPALVGRNDHVFADRLVHASLIDGIRLSGARLHRFAHNDPSSLEALLKRPTEGRRLIVTESVFSMDGDLSPLEVINALASEHGTMLLVDEAHAVGLFGPHGAGRIQELQLTPQPTFAMGTLSKALGGYGGYVACSSTMRQYLIQATRSFIYSTAPAPAVIGAALGALAELEAQSALGAELLARAHTFREALRDAGFNVLQSQSQIIPLRIGDNEKALRFSRRLHEDGLIAVAIRPPTVPPGEARIRLSLTLAHSSEALAGALNVLISAGKAEGLL